MGKYNSSTTRVAPVFDYLFAADPSGATWLPGLLRSGMPDPPIELFDETPMLVAGHSATWGSNELSLPAPLGLLEYLVRSITPEQVEASGDKGLLLEKRRNLARRDPTTVGAHGISLIRV